MSANICNICGANLIYKDGKWVCPACGAYKTEEISNEEVTLLYNAAQKLRLASFDDAEEAYRDIIAKYPENSEGHWGLVLSKYGIKYEDDYDGKKLPTCYATSIESILADKDYLDAVRLCKDKYQKEYYIEQGKVLEKIRIEWLEKASKEPKYDVFLCFKDSDKQNNMERTDDSIEVANLYTHLSSLGYKVFYSRESLRDKVAEKYEPYIYNALNTAAVMIVYGSKIEYFSSVWMKNEWTRYVRRLREGLKIEGSLVVACDGVNPAELPRPLNQMQVLDARKKTFYGDLEAHIAKIISIARRPKVTVERVEITGAIGKKKASVDNQIKTIKVGGNVSKKTPVVIDNAVSVREIGRFDVPELSPDEDTKLKSVNSYIKNELFDNAKKVVDEILEKNKYNGQALLADLLITYKVKNIDELTEKLDEIEDFSQFNTVIEYNDKEIGEKLIAVIGQKIRLAIANSNYDVAIAALRDIVVYNSAEVLNIRLELRNTAKRLLSVSSKTAAEIFDVLLNSYRDGDTYIEYIQGFVDDCLATGNFPIAQKYNDKIIELDDGNLKATFAAAFISVRAKNAIEFVDSADKFIDFKIFDDAIKHFDEDEIKSCFVSLQNVIDGLIKSQKSGEVIADWFDFVVKYEFDGRTEFIEKTINELAELKDLASRAKLFDKVILCIDGSDVERHISMRLDFAKKLQTAGNFNLAEKYYKQVIDIEEGNLDALWGVLLCKLKANRDADLADVIEQFTDFPYFENLLKYCPNMNDRTEYLNKLTSAVVMSSASSNTKHNIEKLSKVFDGLIKYYPEELNTVLVAHLQKFADTCKTCLVFSLAEKYYAMILSIDNMKHEAYWGLLQAKLNCRNNDDLIKQDKIITEFSEFSSAIAASCDDERSSERYCKIAKSQLDYIEKQKNLAKQKKKRKSLIKKLTAMVAVVVAVVIGVFAFVGYRKSESVLKYSPNATGVSVYAGKYYNAQSVEIPAVYNGKPVTEISNGAFNGLSDIKKIVLPDSITKIGDNAFNGATSLEVINIPDNVVSIGESAFADCKKLRKVVIPEKTVKLGKNVFSDCSNLSEITVVARDGGLSGFDDAWKNGVPTTTNIKIGFKITLDYNGATSGDSDKTFIVEGNGNYTLSIPQRDGYKFLGWYDSLSNGNRLTDENGRSVSVYEKQSSITAFACWEANLNTIVFDANGGNGTMADQQIATDSSANLNKCEFTKLGYTFIGWGTTATQKSYDDNAEYSMGTKSIYRLYAIWQANENVLHFNANGGSGEMPDIKIKTDDTKTLPTCGFSRRGYSFMGWGLSESGAAAYADNANYLMGTDSEYVLYALWSLTKYTVSYDLNGGTVSPENKTEYTLESEMFSLTSPTKLGYTFVGWTGTNLSDKTMEVSISSGSIGNLSFTANWEVITYNITYELNGGTSKDALPSTYTVEDNITLPVPVKSGYTFVKWADNGYIPKGSTGDITFTAHWETVKYSIKYDLNGGIVSGGNKTEYTIESDTFTLTNPTKPGYTFIGWTGGNLSEKTFTVSIISGTTENLSFTANYEANLNSLVFNANGGTGTMLKMQIKTDETATLNLNTFTRKGYDFAGWANTKNGEKIYSDGQDYTMGTNGEYILYAVWSITTYSISYDFNLGNSVVNKSNYTVETETFTLTNPSRGGYTFIGWSGTDISDKSKTVTIRKGSIGDRSFIANWQANTNTLRFNANGGSGTMSDMSIKTDETKNLSANTFVRKGYTFKGWANAASGSITYLDKGSYKMGTAPSYTLYAVWEANVNRLNFNGNGADSGSMNEMSVKTDAVVTLPACGFSKTGYSFKGWSKESDGTVAYVNKASYTMGTDSSYTLYAVWEINQYTITLELNGGSAKTTVIKQNYKTLVNAPTATRSGYNFVEWYADKDFSNVYNFAEMPAKNITVYAKWQLDATYTGEIGIRTIQELQAINDYLSGKFYLENDIGAKDFDFKPIGVSGKPFTGQFDGKNYIIDNLTITATNGTNIGFFGMSKGKITNAVVRNAYYQVTGNGWIGGICGYTDNVVDHCSWSGTIITNFIRCGGIAGWSNSVIRKCSVDGTLKGEYTISRFGGIAGEADVIEDCYVNVQIKNSMKPITTYPEGKFGGLIAGTATTIKNTFVGIDSSYVFVYFHGNDYNYDSRSRGVSRLCAEGTITNSFRVGSGTEENIIAPEIIQSRNIMTSQYGWSTDVWCWGYGYPVLYGNNHIKVNYIGVDGLNNDANPDAYEKGSSGFALADITKDGYTFGGWYTDSGFKNRITRVNSITEPLTIYAKWIPNQYSITLNSVGGKISTNTATVTYDSSYTLEVPVRDGCIFLGWFDGTGNSAVAYTDETGKSLSNWTLTEGKTLYAKWKEV